MRGTPAHRCEPRLGSKQTVDRALGCLGCCRRGERFDRQRHVSGTEIKAITDSAMQINEMEGDAEIFVIVDI